ncbi:MAG: glutamate-1-semialdehyde 2,1-aminomutase [Candidatus Melainabacteria bacterium]|nr:glutamate-1-semialdehyde 2,1-aminomutase [Candidatus Melainabacteria bacterium]
MTSLAASAKINAPISKKLSKEIEEVIPGGVNSPFRSFHEVGGHTIFVDRGEGSKVIDADGNEYIDYVGAWGPAILGHGFAPVADAVSEVLRQGPLFGAPHKLELELARKIVASIPSIDMVRFVNSGTEAVMSSLRLARGYTGKDIIIMFEGCYHGHSDSVLASSTHKHSSGIPHDASKNTVVVPFNDLDALDQCLEKHDGQIAGVIIEPVAGSMGVVAPEPGYLNGVRDLCTKYGVVLIFDEVLTGFRVAFGGAQSLYEVEPDLTCFGKALGGGMPIGAYGGKREIMEKLMPIGDVYQAGTFSGNPITMAGAIAILNALSNPSVYSDLDKRTEQLFAGIQKHIDEINQELVAKSSPESGSLEAIPFQLQRVSSMFAFVFAAKAVKNFEDSKTIDAERFAKFFHELLANGVMLPPTAVDAACVSAAHSEADIDRTIVVCANALRKIFL